MSLVNIDQFASLEMRVGLVLSASLVEGSEKLIKLKVDFGGGDERVIFTGVRKWYDPDSFAGKKFVFITNLEPRKMMGEESQGMILAVDGFEGKPVFVRPEEDVEVGAKIR